MTVNPRLRAAIRALATVSVLTACTIKSENTSKGDSNASVQVAFGSDAARAPEPGPDDVRIVSQDGVLVLSIIGDTVRMQLSDSLRNSVASDIQKDGDTSGLAGAITKGVSAVVKGAMGFTVRAAAKDVENLRYENGHILFNVRDGAVKVNSKGNSNEKATFSEDDARRFIDAVKRKASGSIAM